MRQQLNVTEAQVKTYIAKLMMKLDAAIATPGSETISGAFVARVMEEIAACNRLLNGSGSVEVKAKPY